MMLKLEYVFVFLLLVYSAQASDRVVPYFYSISKGENTSYILGTVHLGVGLEDLPPQITQLTKEISQFAFEMHDTAEGINITLSPDYIYGLGHKSDIIRYGQRNLRILHTTDKLRLINEFGIPKELADYFHYDNAYCTQIIYSKYLFTNKKKHLDLEIMLQAYKQKKPLFSLETDLIRHNASRRVTKTESCTVADILKMSAQVIQEKDIVPQYMAGSLSPASVEGYEEAFLYRHKYWIPIMNELIRKKPTLFVVGAQHFLGINSLLKMLEGEGYQIRQILNQ